MSRVESNEAGGDKTWNKVADGNWAILCLLLHLSLWSKRCIRFYEWITNWTLSKWGPIVLYKSKKSMNGIMSIELNQPSESNIIKQIKQTSITFSFSFDFSFPSLQTTYHHIPFFWRHILWAWSFDAFGWCQNGIHWALHRAWTWRWTWGNRHGRLPVVIVHSFANKFQCSIQGGHYWIMLSTGSKAQISMIQIIKKTFRNK